MSSIIGSDQTSKAVGSLVNATNSAISTGNTATTAAQTGVLNAGTNANNVLSGVLNQQLSNLNPYQTLGTNAASSLTSALAPGGSLTGQFSFDPTQIASNPDYQFQLSQGLQAVKQAAAATGTLNSSATQKGIVNYAGGLASNEIGQAYNQALSTFNTNRSNTLQNIALPLSAGQTATSQANTALGQFGQQYGQNLIGTNQTAGNYGMSNANNVEQLLLDQGNAQAAGSIRQGNIWGGFASGAGTGLWNNTPSFGGSNIVGAALGVG